ncbi:MAG: alanine racemase [Candidatus Omnitrophica bacterium]|nr:alanine racemase [Candidatus Omnitrophota bacterium]
MRTTKVIVSLKAIKNNIDTIRKKIGKDVKILACVKTDAYGHGLEKVSKAIQKKTDYFGIASIDEGALLRRIGIKLPILILNCILPEDAKEIIKYNLSPTLCSFEVATALDKEALKKNKKVKVHIDIDTGMGRTGIKVQEAIDFIKKILKFKNLEIEGISTHFPSADESDKNFTCQQIKTLDRLLKDIDAMGIDIPLKHTANSAAVLAFPESHFNMVRPGLAIYGYYLSAHFKKIAKLEPALSLSSRIVCLRKLPKGATISYGRTYTTKRTSLIATLPIGYGEGYSRALSNKGKVIVRGKIAPVVGRVCMDQTMIDVSKIPNVKIGDEVILIGEQKGKKISVEEVASLAGTIPYEIVCMIGKNAKRTYE